MPITYYCTDISPHIGRTPEGYIICRDVPVARTGDQTYLASELGLDGDPDREVIVHRLPEDVFDPAALASLEGKPVTDGHPPGNFGADAFSAYAKGHVQNVRPRGEYVMADLYINDPSLASDVENGVKREVSCGYLCDYIADGDGYRQKHIRLNHVAVVPRGRAGHTVAIQDAAPRAEKGRNISMNFQKAFYTLFGQAAKNASPEELATLVDVAAQAQDPEPTAAGAAVLDGAPAQVSDADPTPAAAPAAEPPVADAEPAPDPLAALDARLCKLEAALAKLLPAETEPHTLDETDIDKAIEKLGGAKTDPGSALAIPVEEAQDGCAAPAADSAVLETLLRRVRPSVAGIHDPAERAAVTEALLSLTGDNGTQVQAIGKAAADAAAAAQQKTATTQTKFQERCEASENAYAAMNPHAKEGN